jgi:hypothetical protein
VLPVKILIIIILLTLFYQDQKDRAVHWLLFPFLVALFIYQKISPYQSFMDNLYEAVYPFGFLGLQLLLLTGYFSLKKGRPVLITQQLIGLGDILLLASLCFYFSLYTYVLFYIISLIVVLLTWVIWQRLATRKTAHIPFAGLQALVLSTVFLWSWFRGPDLRNDYWIFQLLG